MSELVDSYHLLDFLGQGGSGRVFRARRTQPDGFARDVAVKLLHEHASTAPHLRRFREISNTLAVIRDRAIVRFEAPSELDGYWAIVMEYVPGANCHLLLHHLGPLPPRAALEIVQEVARALDHLSQQSDLSGRPLQLVHDDIKPANLQITRSGEVRLLELGVAEAQFPTIESPIDHVEIRGTEGYIAPERFQGIHLPAGDIFALGVVLYQLVTKGSTDRQEMSALYRESSGSLRSVLDIAMRMVHDNPDVRPTAREVEGQCSTLAARLDELDLRRWAESHVPHRIGTQNEPLCGTVLTAVPGPLSTASFVAAAPPRGGFLTTLTMVNIFIITFVLTIVVGLGVAAWWLIGQRPEPLAVDAGPTTITLTSWTLRSNPDGADVFVDGTHVGKTPVLFGLAPGLRDVEMALGDVRSSTSVEVIEGRSRALSWDSAADGWTNLPARKVVKPKPTRTVARKRRRPRPEARPLPEPIASEVLEVLEPIEPGLFTIEDLSVEEGSGQAANASNAAGDVPLDSIAAAALARPAPSCTPGLLACPLRVSSNDVKSKVFVQPSYPANAQSMGLGDQSCRVTIVLDDRGVPDNVNVEVCPIVFHEEIRRAVRQSRWAPYRVDKERKAVRFTMLFRFRQR